MKEMIVVFIICLCVGSWLNSTQLLPWGMLNPASATGQIPGSGGLVGSDLIAEVDEGSFQGQVLDAREPVLVEFYTDNCPHCKTVAPVLAKLAFDGQGVIRICKINASKNQPLTDRYGVAGVPAFLLFRDGQMQETTSGALEASDMRAWLAAHDIKIPAGTPTSI